MKIIIETVRHQAGDSKKSTIAEKVSTVAKQATRTTVRAMR